MFKIAWNGEKIGQKWFWDFLAPPNKIWGAYKKFCQKWKNQSCSKLPELARKLVENDFWKFNPPPKKINKLGGRTNLFVKLKKKLKFFKVAWNGKKIIIITMMEKMRVRIVKINNIKLYKEERNNKMCNDVRTNEC